MEVLNISYQKFSELVSFGCQISQQKKIIGVIYICESFPKRVKDWKTAHLYVANICGNIWSSGTSYVENKEWQIKFSFGVQYYQILMKYEDEVDLASRMLQVIYIRKKLTAWVLYFGVVVASYSFLENTQWAKEKINRILFCFFPHGIFK